ncbi:Bet_v_1 domain-containing protein [Cephalotus follicularis]|uniref:Bet_v_1 domain-containing protein n=1 Tax=Cephalotus follicularis TaxID=3775 RepID=A0A1Q3BI16_CEPFO|nr:Bet_v_1 domain-containing protein [Cephalotus follicularis]
MALRVETEVELKSPPEKLYKLFQKEAHLLPTTSPNNLQAVELHEGGWETHGSVKLWSYTFGKATLADVSSAIWFFDVMSSSDLYPLNFKSNVINYKSYKAIFHCVPKGEGSLAKLALEYEKLREDVPDDLIERYLDFSIRLAKDKDTHLLKA